VDITELLWVIPYRICDKEYSGMPDQEDKTYS